MTRRSDCIRLSTAAHAADAAGFPYCDTRARARVESQYGISAASAASAAAGSGSNLDALLADACVVVAWLIQHGAERRDLAASMGRLNGRAVPVIRARGFNPADHNEADALAILLWAIETQGGVR
jgi:hypothetical protein